MTTTVSQAVARKDEGPGALIARYSPSFAAVLPSHIKPDAWVRLAQYGLRKGRRLTDGPQRGMFELEAAAANNPGVFLAALLDAARLGLEPATEQYYLTPRKVKGKLEVLGIVGYQGHIELIYRAGAVSSVVAEVVREHDDYRYQRGVDDVPVHRFPPFARDADRGRLIGVYAYARMKDGAVSRVVELSQDDIDRVKRSSPDAAGEHSPWVNHETAMWLKASVRQLQKWVPTSAEYRREQMRAAVEYTKVAGHGPPARDEPDSDVVDGDVVEEPGGWPDTAQPPDAS